MTLNEHKDFVVNQKYEEGQGEGVGGMQNHSTGTDVAVMIVKSHKEAMRFARIFLEGKTCRFCNKVNKPHHNGLTKVRSKEIYNKGGLPDKEVGDLSVSHPHRS